MDKPTPAPVAHTPGPWRWQGEDYRAGWGWMMLVGPEGEGLIVGQSPRGGMSEHLKAYQPVDPALCLTGFYAEGKPHVEPVHVFTRANARLIAAAPDMLAALKETTALLERICIEEGQWPEEIIDAAHAAIAKAEKGE